jgi:hypothetical protein
MGHDGGAERKSRAGERAGAGTHSSSSSLSSSSRGGRATSSARVSLSWRAPRTACCALRGAFLVAAVALRGCIAALRSWCSGPRSASSHTSSRSCPRAHERAPNFGCKRARRRKRSNANARKARARAESLRYKDEIGMIEDMDSVVKVPLCSKRLVACAAPNRRVLVRLRWFRSARTHARACTRACVRACVDACVWGSHLYARACVAACAHAVAHSGALVRRLSPRPRR